ncbi:unnamed protein product [Protopolystoma xenopodis]|uniref:Uncharacterized protein n=1 Tax=Protopolystoma xenopodis TaxID=117903 RepID=A0A448XH52_9PLAT|nr:unnamed protein product [Protopolystoma xenopodis]
MLLPPPYTRLTPFCLLPRSSRGRKPAGANRVSLFEQQLRSHKTVSLIIRQRLSENGHPFCPGGRLE